MFKSSVFILLFGTVIFFTIQSLNGQVKKSANEIRDESYESSKNYVNENQGDDKKKRSRFEVDDRESRNELLKDYFDRLVKKYRQIKDLDSINKKRNQAEKFFDGYFGYDDKLDNEFYDPREEHDDDDDENDDDDQSYERNEFDERKKKSNFKNKRFRANYRKRNSLQNRFKKFRANF